MANKTMKRKYVIGLFVLLAMATVSTYAWSIDTSLNTDPTKVYVTTNANTTTTVSGYSSKPLGKNKIEIKFTTASASADVDWMFLDGSGDIVNCTYTVKLDTVTITKNSDFSYSKAALATGAHTIEITGTGVWKDLNSVTGGDQTFNGLMLVIK